MLRQKSKTPIELPGGELGPNRRGMLSRGTHHELTLEFWIGHDEHYPPNRPPKSLRQFSVKAGSEPVLLSCLAGFLNRAGVSRGEIRETFDEAMPEKIKAIDEKPYLGLNLFDYRGVIRGRSLPELGWSSLVEPIPSRNGTVSEVGGTGIYTRVDLMNQHRLVIASIPPQRDLEIHPELPSRLETEFCRTDIPELVRGIGQIACDESAFEVRRIHSTI